MASKELTELSIKQATNPVGTVAPIVTAKDLATPPKPAKFTEPGQPTVPTRTTAVAKNVATDLTNFITAQSEEAKQLEARRQEFAALGAEPGLSDLYNQKASEFGATSANLKELKDIQLQLADATTNSELTKTKVAGAAGQTMGQAQRELTQEDRENAVRNAGLAARAAVLQGNIETGRALAKDAVDIAYQDRQLRNQNLINQINDLSGTVDKQTQQLLDKEKRAYEEDQARLEDLKRNIADAVVSGAATQSEIAQLNDPNMDDEMKTALAQSIIARGAGQDRALDRSAKLQSISSSRTNELLALAKAGDPGAIAQLGFDPSAVESQLNEESNLSETEKRQARDRIRAGTSLANLTSQYRDLVAEYGFEGRIVGNKEVLGKYNALRGQILSEYKDVKNLGTLDAGLITLMDQIIGELPEGNAIANNLFNIKSDKIVSQLDNFLAETNRQLVADKVAVGELGGVIDDNDLTEIDTIFGSPPQSSGGSFNPSLYY